MTQRSRAQGSRTILASFDLLGCALSALVLLATPSYADDAECLVACVIGAGDIDGDGAGDMAMLIAQAGGVTSRFYMLSGASGATLTRRTLDDPNIAITAMRAIADANGDGIGDIALLASDSARGSVFIELRDPITGFRIERIFFDKAYTPLALLAGRDGREIALGVLGRDASGRLRTQLKRASDGGLISLVFFDRRFDPRGVVLLTSIDADGTPDIAVLGVNATGLVRAQIKDLHDGMLKSLVYFDRRFAPLAFREGVDLDGNGVPDIIVLGIDELGLVRAQIKDAASGTRTGLVTFEQGFETLGFVVVGDVGSPSIGVLGRNDSGLIRLQLKNAISGSREAYIRYASGSDPKSIANVPDTDGFGFSELAVVARAANGNVALQMKDAATGVPLLSRLLYPDSAPPPADADGDGASNSVDRFPNDSAETLDADSDGVGNNADPDDDNDGVADVDDAFPFDFSEFADSDGDGIGDVADPDDDNDGIPDALEGTTWDDHTWGELRWAP